MSRKSIPYRKVVHREFANNLPDVNSIRVGQGVIDINYISREIANIVYDTCVVSQEKRANVSGSNPVAVTSTERWKNITSTNDPKTLWNAINWNGSFDNPVDSRDKPSDEDFCRHYTQLLYNERYAPLQMHNNNVYIPVLDDDFTPEEVYAQILKLKVDKAAGPDGVPPGIAKLLDDDWILLLTDVFNAVFDSEYPDDWKEVKVFNIFKKGDNMDPSNYRGISIMPFLAKLYDALLAERLRQWYSPREAQAGAQKGRGCEEQILAVRLLIDIAKKSKKKLYIAFVDYVKAYDRVDRNALVRLMEEKGCGSRFLRAVGKSLCTSSGLVGEKSFKVNSGVKQGGSTSCPLFTLLIDSTIDALTETGDDDWLGNLHCLLFMDDTAVFASSREKLQEKLIALKSSATNVGMVIHPTKSKFMTVNCTDNNPVILGDVNIAPTVSYCYLGANISSINMQHDIREHAKIKEAQLLKFSSFLYKNNDASFETKKTVWNACVTSALLYGCETWLCSSYPTINKLYSSSVKRLLSVRSTTSNNLVFLESGIPSSQQAVKDKQLRYFEKLVNRENYNNSFIKKLIDQAIMLRTPMGKYFSSNIQHRNSPAKDTLLDCVRIEVREQDKTRYNTYLEINPQLCTNWIYSADITERQRIQMTRLRLSSHRLAIESGRWSRQPRERRLCACGSVQNESHVLFSCPRSNHIRLQFPCLKDYSTIDSLLDNPNPNHFKIIANYVSVICDFFMCC